MKDDNLDTLNSNTNKEINLSNALNDSDINSSRMNLKNINKVKNYSYISANKFNKSILDCNNKGYNELDPFNSDNVNVHSFKNIKNVKINSGASKSNINFYGNLVSNLSLNKFNNQNILYSKLPFFIANNVDELDSIDNKIKSDINELKAYYDKKLNFLTTERDELKRKVKMEKSLCQFVDNFDLINSKLCNEIDKIKEKHKYEMVLEKDKFDSRMQDIKNQLFKKIILHRDENRKLINNGAETRETIGKLQIKALVEELIFSSEAYENLYNLNKIMSNDIKIKNEEIKELKIQNNYSIKFINKLKEIIERYSIVISNISKSKDNILNNVRIKKFNICSSSSNEFCKSKYFNVNNKIKNDNLIKDNTSKCSLKSNCNLIDKKNLDESKLKYYEELNIYLNNQSNILNNLNYLYNNNHISDNLESTCVVQKEPIIFKIDKNDYNNNDKINIKNYNKDACYKKEMYISGKIIYKNLDKLSKLNNIKLKSINNKEISLDGIKQNNKYFEFKNYNKFLKESNLLFTENYLNINYNKKNIKFIKNNFVKDIFINSSNIKYNNKLINYPKLNVTNSSFASSYKNLKTSYDNFNNMLINRNMYYSLKK